MFNFHKKEAPLLGLQGSGGGLGYLAGGGGSNLGTWGNDADSDFSSDGVYQLKDVSSDQTFYTYIKSYNSKKALLVLACRDQTSGSHFYYSNGWWSSRVKINDTSSAANPITNTSTNFCSEAFFRVPVKGAFITPITDATHGDSWLEYTGTFNNMNSLPSGGVAASQATSANLVGMQATARGGSFVSSGSTYARDTLRHMGMMTGSPLGSIGSDTGLPSDNNQSFRPGNSYWMSFNPDDSYAHSSNSKGRARLGKTWAWEHYQGGSYSAGGFGFGVAADDQDGGTGSPGVQAGSGYMTARSNAGNSGINEYDRANNLELWINPQDNWDYEVL